MTLVFLLTLFVAIVTTYAIRSNVKADARISAYRATHCYHDREGLWNDAPIAR